jgi:D-alanine--poly(phosphoribitol) ligase subunit 1
MPALLHDNNLGNLFFRVVSEHATRPALRYAGREHRFAELGSWVDSLAALLLSEGLSRGDVIAIGHNKHPLSYALMLAAIRLGLPYVNLDVGSPIARNARILAVCAPKLLFYDDNAYESEMIELATSRGCAARLLDFASLPIASPEERAFQKECAGLVDGATIAYVMFTSGSTGIPKGVAVTHQNVLHLIAWGSQRFGITEQDNFANLSPMYFDNSVFDFYVGLFSGASLSPIHRSMLPKPYELVRHVSDLSCTVWFSVPSALMYLMSMKALGAGVLSELRMIIFGGEGYPKIELKKLYERFREQASLVNVYGPTECTCICSGHTISMSDFDKLDGLPTLGRLNPNFDHQIVDENGHDAIEGELCLIGPNVAAGYFNDLERTNVSFQMISDPARFMKRMYRTGDLVREEGGRLYFLGRKDNQIKHMGYRIELEEIENALAQLPHVEQAAVVYVRGQSTHGKLVGFIATSAARDEAALLHELGQLLPPYMRPSRLVTMQALPKNPNGKVDRQQLRDSLVS